MTYTNIKTKTACFWIVIPCQECEGEGVLADRHPNDPSCQLIECHVCGGEGEVEVNNGNN